MSMELLDETCLVFRQYAYIIYRLCQAGPIPEASLLGPSMGNSLIFM
jgi:hypothetical protein